MNKTHNNIFEVLNSVGDDGVIFPAKDNATHPNKVPTDIPIPDDVKRIPYIYFSAIVARFETPRAFLIPYDEFLDSRRADLNRMREHGIRNHGIERGVKSKESKHLTKKFKESNYNKTDKTYTLVQPILWEGNMGTHKNVPFSNIVSILIDCAEDRENYRKATDKLWVKKCIWFNYHDLFISENEMEEKIKSGKISWNGNPIKIVEKFYSFEEDIYLDKEENTSTRDTYEKLVGHMDQIVNLE